MAPLLFLVSWVLASAVLIFLASTTNGFVYVNPSIGACHPVCRPRFNKSPIALSTVNDASSIGVSIETLDDSTTTKSSIQQDIDDATEAATAAIAVAAASSQGVQSGGLLSRGSSLEVARHAIPISIALIIGTFSVLEILESLRELTERQLGHAHGVTVLAALRLGRSMAFFKLLRTKKRAAKMVHRAHRASSKHHKTILSSLKMVRSKAFVKAVRSAATLQTQTEEFDERVEELGHVVGSLGTSGSGTHHLRNEAARDETYPKPEKKTLQSSIMNFITSPGVAISAALLALLACVVEIIDDMKPGAHHGAALLALSEFYYQSRRLKARVKKERNRTSTWRTSSWMGRLWDRMPVGPIIAVVAAIYAGIEVFEDMKPGAHHGVAILSFAELVENLNRSRIVHQLPQVAEATSSA